MSTSDSMFGWYQDYYAAVERSRVYAAYCERVFGRDFSQQGFSDLRQIEAMLDILNLKSESCVLDVGCGNGKLIEYIADVTGCAAFGFDYSPVAIEAANRRTEHKRDRLTFEVGSIGVKQYPPETFDAVIAIDTIFFADDLGQALRDMLGWLRPCGKLVIFYSAFRFDPHEPLDKLLPDGTALAQAFHEACVGYSAEDFTRSHFEHMRLKKRVALEFQRDFEAEGTMLLFDNIRTESIDADMDYDSFRTFSTRYLYIAEKVNSVFSH